MTMVLITALGVGGATMIGALLGFLFKKQTHKFSDIVLSFAAGVMFSAAVPSDEVGALAGFPVVLVLAVVSAVLSAALLSGSPQATAQRRRAARSSAKRGVSFVFMMEDILSMM